MKKRLFATLLALVMALGLTATAWADDPVTGVEYVDEDGTTKTCDTYETVTSSSSMVTWGEAGKTKWYVANETVAINNYVTVNGDVKLILMDGKRLEVTGGLVGPEIGGQIYGIFLTSGASLTVYGQSAGTGTLDAPAVGLKLCTAGNGAIKPNSAFGINLNGGSLTINGGHVMAGVTVSNATIYGLYDGTLNMNGGKLTATSYNSNRTSIPICEITIQSACCKWRTTGSGDYTAGSNIPTDQDQFAFNTKDHRYLEIVAGHEFDDLVPATPATCTESGTVAHKTCAICGKHFDADGNVIADENLTIPATGHASPLTHVPAKPATRQEAGNIEYWQCSKCQQCFTDEAGQTPIDQADTVIAKLPPKKTPSTPATPAETVASPKTADPGVLLSAALSVASLLGMGYVGKKR